LRSYSARACASRAALVDGAELVGVGMDVDEALLGDRCAHEGVAGGGDLPQAPADGQEDVGLADAARERRIHGQPDVPGVGARGVVDVVLAAKRGGHRHAPGLGEGGDVGAGPRGPPALPHDRERSPRRREQLAQARHRLRRGRRRKGVQRPRVRHLDLVGEHVLGQREHDRPRASRGRHREGPRDDLG
jgi:hypothetical protein